MNKHFIKIIVLISIMFSCSTSNNVFDEYDGVPGSQPISIIKFINNKDMLIEDTLLINTKNLNDVLNYDYLNYKKYSSSLKKLNFRCCKDFIITGIDSSNNEYYVAYYTQFNDGLKIWDSIEMGDNKKDVQKVLNSFLIDSVDYYEYFTSNDYVNYLYFEEKVLKSFLSVKVNSINGINKIEPEKIINLDFK